MSREIISISTATKIAELENENKKLKLENRKLQDTVINYTNEYEKLYGKLKGFFQYIKDRKEVVATKVETKGDNYSDGKLVGRIKELDLMEQFLKEDK